MKQLNFAQKLGHPIRPNYKTKLFLFFLKI